MRVERINICPNPVRVTFFLSAERTGARNDPTLGESFWNGTRTPRESEKGNAACYPLLERTPASVRAFSNRNRRRASIRMRRDSSKTLGCRSRENGKP